MSRTLLLLAAGASCACAAAVVEDAPLVDADSAAPVIATLQLRDRELTVASTASGVRYGVSDSSGTRSQLTLDELEALAPELADIVRSASARAGFGVDARLDASVVSGSEPALWAGRMR